MRSAFFTACIAGTLIVLSCSPSQPPQEAPSTRVPVEDFFFPDEHARLLQPELQQFRRRRPQWGEQDVAPFWVSPTQLGIDWLRERSDQEIERLLETID